MARARNCCCETAALQTDIIAHADPVWVRFDALTVADLKIRIRDWGKSAYCTVKDISLMNYLPLHFF